MIGSFHTADFDCRLYQKVAADAEIRIYRERSSCWDQRAHCNKCTSMAVQPIHFIILSKLGRKQKSSKLLKKYAQIIDRIYLWIPFPHSYIPLHTCPTIKVRNHRIWLHMQHTLYMQLLQLSMWVYSPLCIFMNNFLLLQDFSDFLY